MLVDAEHCFDPYYSKAVGVDVESLIVCQPDNGEMALESNKPLSYIIHQVLKLAFELSPSTLSGPLFARVMENNLFVNI